MREEAHGGRTRVAINLHGSIQHPADIQFRQKVEKRCKNSPFQNTSKLQTIRVYFTPATRFLHWLVKAEEKSSAHFSLNSVELFF